MSKPITSEEFDRALVQALGDYLGLPPGIGRRMAKRILQIPGVYEEISEHLNNEAIEIAEEERDKS